MRPTHILRKLSCSRSWNWNTTFGDIQAAYRAITEITQLERNLAPTSGAYFVSILYLFGCQYITEKCFSPRTRTKEIHTNPIMRVSYFGLPMILEFDHKEPLVSFWGNHYSRLVEVKKK